MRCVECGAFVERVYMMFGGTIRLTHCKACGKVADKYVEVDYLILFLELVLLRPPAYRHLLFNQLPFQQLVFGVNCYRIGLLYILIEAYLKYAALQEMQSIQPLTVTFPRAGLRLYPVETYLAILATALSELVVFVCVALIATYIIVDTSTLSSTPMLSSSSSQTDLAASIPPATSSPVPQMRWQGVVIMGILASTFAKPVQAVLVLWDKTYHYNNINYLGLSPPTLLDLFVLLCTIVTLGAYFASYKRATTVVISALCAKLAFKAYLHADNPAFFPFIM